MLRVLPSGARVGLAVEVRDRLQVQWNDPSDPSQGFQGLYLTDKDYQHLQAMATQQGKGGWATACNPGTPAARLRAVLPFTADRGQDLTLHAAGPLL